MKSIEIIGYNRANLGKTESKKIRSESNVPCVLYGGAEQVHFHSPMFLFRDLVYTPATQIVELNIEGKQFKAVLQDIQFHPVNETILHADFLQLHEDKEVKVEVPIKFEGTAPGVQKGGKFVQKVNRLKIIALPKDLPDFVTVNISGLDLGKSVRVKDVNKGKFAVLNTPELPVASITIPRALKGKEQEDAKKK